MKRMIAVLVLVIFVFLALPGAVFAQGRLGDLNGDRIVGIQDFILAYNSFYNKDNVYTITDLVAVFQNWDGGPLTVEALQSLPIFSSSVDQLSSKAATQPIFTLVVIDQSAKVDIHKENLYKLLDEQDYHRNTTFVLYDGKEDEWSPNYSRSFEPKEETNLNVLIIIDTRHNFQPGRGMENLDYFQFLTQIIGHEVGHRIINTENEFYAESWGWSFLKKTQEIGKVVLGEGAYFNPFEDEIGPGVPFSWEIVNFPQPW